MGQNKEEKKRQNWSLAFPPGRYLALDHRKKGREMNTHVNPAHKNASGIAKIQKIQGKNHDERDPTNRY